MAVMVLTHYKSSLPEEKKYTCGLMKGVIFMKTRDHIIKERMGHFLSKKESKWTIIFICIVAMLAITQIVSFSKESNSVDFSNPEYQKLLQSVISDKEKKMQEDVKNTKGILIPAEVLNRYKYADGTYDYKAMLKEINLEPKIYKEHEALKTYKYSVIKSGVVPHVLANGEEGVYCNETDKEWDLKKGDVVKLTIYADPNYFNSSGNIYIGYIKDNKHFQLDDFIIKEKKEIEIKIPQSGDYEFYLFCASMNPIIIKQLQIELN